MHPVEEIRCRVSDELANHLVVLGVSYSAAIYRAIDVARELVRRCADVIVAMTPSARKAIDPKLFHWATGRKPITSITGDVEHVTYARRCSSMAVAPATLRTMSAIAWGCSNNVVTSMAITARSAGKPVLIVPAMHLDMWRSPQCRKVVELLREEGYSILPPVMKNGRLVMAKPSYVARKIVALTLRGEDLRGLRIVVTAGATREFIDGVRFVSNPSSGRMGIAIAFEAFARGAEVVLVHGHLEVEVPPWIESYEAISTEDMARKLLEVVKSFDPHVVVMAAAPSDFRPRQRFEGKIPSGIEKLVLELVPTPKILKEVRKVFKGILVGFAAEYTTDVNELVERGSRKLAEYDLDLIVVNSVAKPGIGFGSAMNEVVMIDRKGSKSFVGPALKEVVARAILDKVKELVSR